MSSKAQTIFFFLIVFLFASGAGLLIYKNYSDYYNQKTQVELESGLVPVISAGKDVKK